MEWHSSKILILGIYIFSISFNIAKGAAQRVSVLRSATQRVLETYQRNHSFACENLQTWDLLLVEEKDTDTAVHVGMAFRDASNKLLVLEAIPILGVKSTDFDTFKERSRYNNIYALRPQENYLDILQQFEEEALKSYFEKKLSGLPYNYTMIENYEENGVKHYYCSQLLRDMYNYVLKIADPKIDIAPLKPMKFKEFFARQLVQSQGFSIPLNMPGVSPADFGSYNFCYLGYITKHFAPSKKQDPHTANKLSKEGASL
ncbi:MAG: YiiX/YebB-like N1pC/P60 family cysteine hydrolase [Oligoflexales bacterium]